MENVNIIDLADFSKEKLFEERPRNYLQLFMNSSFLFINVSTISSIRIRTIVEN